MKQGAFQVSPIGGSWEWVSWVHLGVGLLGSSGSGSLGVIWEWASWGLSGSGALGSSGSGSLGSAGSGTLGVIWKWDPGGVWERVIWEWAWWGHLGAGTQQWMYCYSAPYSIQRWNQRLVTLEDGKLLLSKDALVSCVLNGSL